VGKLTGRGLCVILRVLMTTAIAKIEEMTASLPDDARAVVEARIVEQAEIEVNEYQEHLAQVKAARAGFEEFQRGDLIPAEKVFADLRQRTQNQA